MISDKALAVTISELMLEASGALSEAAQLVAKSGSTEEEKASLLEAIGGAMGQIGIDILNPLYRAHPELKPSDFLLPEDFKDQ